jgi:hypothetical protein
MTPWGIESATFRFAAQCLNQLRHRGSVLQYVLKYSIRLHFALVIKLILSSSFFIDAKYFHSTDARSQLFDAVNCTVYVFKASRRYFGCIKSEILKVFKE